MENLSQVGSVYTAADKIKSPKLKLDSKRD
jgi:hypothetical protein